MVAAIGLGSNLDSAWGDREATLEEAIRRTGSLGITLVVSSFRDTAPVGFLEQPRFLNGAMLLATELPADELMRGLLGIEVAMGRVRGMAKGPRVVDLDLLLYGDQTIGRKELTVPHPGLVERRFVLEPMAEIAPDMPHPVTGLTMRELLHRLKA